MTDADDYSEWKHTREGQRDLLVAACLTVADAPGNAAAVAELRMRLERWARSPLGWPHTDAQGNILGH